MISLNSFIRYIAINGGLMLLSLFHYFILSSTQVHIFLKILSFILKNILFVKVLNSFVVYNKNKIGKTFEEPKENFPHEFSLYLSSSSLIEMCVFYLLGFENTSVNFAKDLMLFIPVSFVFEVIFDFFHYWAHRIVHMNSFLYKHVHKTHHTHNHVAPIVTFIQHPIDLILSNSMPLYFSLSIMKNVMGINISFFMLICILTYKSYIEVAGHSDVETKRTCSFAQCIWLARALNIQLFSKHHIMHHTHVTKNFSKRFSLWDKVFDTFKYI